jgi:hypothetical protein
MKRQPGKRRWFALIAIAPIIAGGLALGTSSPALAVTRATCPGVTWVCFYADINDSPQGSANDVLALSANHSDWAQISDPAHVCGGIITHTWNDCASSVDGLFRTLTMYAWTNSGCQGMRLNIPPNTDYPDLRSVMGGQDFNDVISSDKVGNSSSGC